ncbi:MAG: ABC transporter substrate-binding protein [Oscillospiraceae bacterium]|nr:ABC transporter substrate-binding protein [Oscillospiraceae bacterium]
MKRLAALLLSAALAAGMLSGCNTGEYVYIPTGDGLTWGEPTQPTSSVTEQQMTLPYFPERGLNPYKSGDYVNKNVFSLIYQGLFALDAKYNVYPVLCKSYTVSRDMKTYTFYPQAATFPDGDKLTAADVAASLKAAMNSDLYKGRFGYVKSINVTDDGGVTVVLTTPYENFPNLLDMPVLKQSQLDEERPLGTGPYLYEKYGESLRLRRRTDWWCAAVLPLTAEHIELLEGESPAQLRDAFEFAGLGLVTADPGSSSYVDYHSDYELWDCENGIFVYLGCNSKSEVFSNQAVRSALTYAIDRGTLVEEYYNDFASATVLPVSPQSPWYSDSLAQKYSYDPQRLKRAVTDAGLEGAEVKLLVNTDDSIRLRTARAIADMLRQCGLKVTMSERNTKGYLSALKSKNFDLYLGQTRLSANMDLSEFFDTNGSLNYGGMSDAALYGLSLDALANSGNYYTLHQKVLEDGKLCPILFRSYAVFAQRGMFSDLIPARDNVFFYHLGRTMDDALRTEE